MTGRALAPPALSLVERFLRTRRDVRDPNQLQRWCREHGLPGRVTTDLFDRAIGLREALRALAYANNGGPPVPDAVALVNREIDRCGLHPRLVPAPDGRPGDLALALPPAPGAERLLLPVLSGVLAAIGNGTWSRMKACAAVDCRYAFYDHTKNRSARWCDVSGCGASARMRAYRQRNRGVAGQPGVAGSGCP